MDIVYIHDLRIETVIGIFDWERECKQTVSLDLEMGTDIRAAAASESRLWPSASRRSCWKSSMYHGCG